MPNVEVAVCQTLQSVAIKSRDVGTRISQSAQWLNYQLRNWGMVVQLPAGARDFSKKAQPDSGMHSDYCTMGTTESFSETKRPGREVWQLYLEPTLRMTGAIPPLPYVPHAAHRNKFTCNHRSAQATNIHSSFLSPNKKNLDSKWSAAFRSIKFPTSLTDVYAASGRQKQRSSKSGQRS